MRYTLDKVIDNADATLATVQSDPISALSFTQVSIVAKAVTAGTTGVLKVQVSNDEADFSRGPDNWVDLGVSVNITGPGNFVIPTFNSSYAWIKLVYTKTTSNPGSKINAFLKSNGY